MLRGSPLMPKTVQIFDAATAGAAIGHFTGQPVTASLTLPTTSGARAALRTGSGRGGMRLEGFLDLAAIPAQSTRNLPIVADHVWIAGGKTVSIAAVVGAQVTVELTAGAPIEQTARATTACDGLSLDQQTVRQSPIPGEARGYLVKKSPLDLRPSPGAAAAFTLSSSSVKDALLFWSTESKSGQVHIHLASDFVIDAWAAASDLEALKAGEMMDALSPGITTVSAPKIAMQGELRTAKVTKEVPVRGHANDSSAVIGAIEAEGEVLILETVLGWSSVVPAALNMMPPDGQGFWVKTADLGLPTSPPPKK